MRKLPHFLDCGIHLKGHGHKEKAESKRNYCENFDKIFRNGKKFETTGKIVEQKPGYTKIVIEEK